MAILNQESSLMEIVKLIGSDVLPDDQKLTLEIARSSVWASCSRTLFTQEDTCVSYGKAVQDDGNHPVSVREVPCTRKPWGCRFPC